MKFVNNVQKTFIEILTVVIKSRYQITKTLVLVGVYVKIEVILKSGWP